jgi:tight adherence protein B
MDVTLVKLATFVAAVFAVVGIFSIISDLVLREKQRIKDRFHEEFGGDRLRQARKMELFKGVKSLAQSPGRMPALWKRFIMMVEQSGLRATPARVLQIALTAAIVAAIIGTTVTGVWVVGLACAILGMLGPIAYVHAVRNRRMHALCMQLPETFDMMSRAIRAGQTMSGAMHLAATQLKPPIAAELAACCEQQNFGLPQDVALQELARRTGVMELQMFVVAMLVNRNAGGNVAEILENLSGTIRKRIRLLGKAKAATSEGRLQALVLSVLPMFVFAALVVLNRPYAQKLLDRPGLLTAVLISEALGALWIRHIVNFQY